MKKNRYGNLTNVIAELYKMRKSAVGVDAVAVQKALSLAFDISYGRPVQNEAMIELTDASYKLAPNTMIILNALKSDVIKFYPDVEGRVKLYLTFGN